MTPRLPLCALALAAITAAGGALAQSDKVADDCEAAVTEAVKRMRGKDAQDVQFAKSRRVFTATGDDETSLRGEGRYKGASGRAMPFNYSCAFNAKTGATSGVVFRELAPLADEKTWQPNLTYVSPEACEGAAAATLKTKNPRVGRIVLDSESRRLSPGPDDRIVLEGRGALERAPGMNSVPFTYACEVEPRNGRIVSIRTSQ
ncbi:MAG: hypothetical protein U1E89_08955 [Burkholderiaceae bacterium]